jgi:protein-disulfide isomerase
MWRRPTTLGAETPPHEGKRPVIDRRTFLRGAAALSFAMTVAALLPAAFGLPVIQPASAQEPNKEELMVAGPLGDHVLGQDSAPVTVIEYASMTCPHCAHFNNEVFPALKSKYIDTGKVRYILREFPLDPVAAAGFMLAQCAGKDKYFPVIDALFRTQRSWIAASDPVEGLFTVAKQTGFSRESFEQCLANQQLLDGVEWVRQRASEKFGVNSTPTFFVNGKIERGAPSVEELDKMLAPYLPS